MLAAPCRKLHLAHRRVIAGNYALSGLMGFERRGKTVGLIGTGAIGVKMCRIIEARAAGRLLLQFRPAC